MTNICKNCKHSRRGHAIDRRPIRARSIRPSLRGGDYICARLPIVPAKPDPQTGFVGLPSGEDCRDLNPDGNCTSYERGLGSGDLPLIFTVGSLALAVIVAVALTFGGW